jgi:hypothetical protein
MLNKKSSEIWKAIKKAEEGEKKGGWIRVLYTNALSKLKDSNMEVRQKGLRELKSASMIESLLEKTSKQ